MDDLATVQAVPQAAEALEELIEQMLAEMTRLNQQMLKDRADINRLTAETRDLKAETRALLAAMGARL